MMGLSQEQFGLWSALAIHETSSVVGAGSTRRKGAGGRHHRQIGAGAVDHPAGSVHPTLLEPQHGKNRRRQENPAQKYSLS